MKRKDTPVNEPLERMLQIVQRSAALNNINYYQPKERAQKCLNV